MSARIINIQGESVATEKFMDLSKYHDLDVKSVKMRALTGEDLIVAAGRCAPTEGSSIDATMFSVMLRQQQIAQSITEVDGEPTRGPCLSSLRWNSRTRSFVGMLYDHLNGISAEESDSFMAALKGGSAPVIQPVESDNG